MDTPDNVCRARPLLGTFVEIRSAGRVRAATERAIDAAFGAIAKVHRLMSFHDPDSDVSRLNREASRHNVAVHPWTLEVLQSALTLHRDSGGVFDVTIAPVLQRLGLLPRHKLDSEDDLAEDATSDAIELLSGHRVRFHHPSLRIDLGGIAKGFAVDRAIDILCKRNQSHGLVNAGGDLAAFGRLPETILIRNPRVPRDPLCQVAIANGALASSARSFDPFAAADCFGSSTIDPTDQKPAMKNAGATVRAQSCTIADALTKVVMIAGEQATTLLNKYQASALFVSISGEVRVTSDW